MASGQTDGVDFKERLIATVKKEVKQIMEESVTRKYVHEESGSVTSLCGAVEACLSQGLRRRALGLFKTSSTTALLHKVAKHCPEAAYISKKILDIENCDPTKRSSSSSDSTSKPPILKKNSTNSMFQNNTNSGSCTSHNNNFNNNSNHNVQPTIKYLWIRLALYERKLSKIIDHLVSNATRYYERDSLVADADYGSILSSLLVGPCTLEFSRVKTPDHYWSDPPADELLLRHRISSGNQTPPSGRRPILNFKRSLNTSSDDACSQGSFKSSSGLVAKDYVESLHQNSRTTLLYGKNNVLVIPKGLYDPMPGYLSLHQTACSLTIKWTPNQLMNNHSDNEVIDKAVYWEYSLNINIEEIVYVHCHQARGEDTGGTIVLVGQDGVQRPPIHFPEGGHMASFLSCLETGLLPHGQLDPPLWSQKGIGKIFPWAPKGRRRPLPSVLESATATTTTTTTSSGVSTTSTAADELPIDYVFRVVNKTNHEEFREFLSKFQINHLKNKLCSVASHPILEMGRSTGSVTAITEKRTPLSSCSTNESSETSNTSMSLDHTTSSSTDSSNVAQSANQSTTIALVCSTMRRQIISRAFYGWLAYCRHLSTVRTHLSGLVHGRITPEYGTAEGLTKERWENLHTDGVVADDIEVYRLVYFGGVQHEIRKEVWPYLLGHYSFGTTVAERKEHDETARQVYETTMSEWLAVEAIVRQRDKEKTAHAVAKLSSESGSEIKTKGLDIDGEIENEVFEDNGYSDSDPDDSGFNKKNIPLLSSNEQTTMMINNETNDKICNEKNHLKTDDKEDIADDGDGNGNGNNDIVEIENVTPLKKTLQKTPRKNKSSSDSGNVPDVDDIQTVLVGSGSMEKLHSSNTEPDIVKSNNSSSYPSSSGSYETVANDFQDITNERIDIISPIIHDDDDVLDDDNDNDDNAVRNTSFDNDNTLNSMGIDKNRGARHSVIITDASIDIVNLQSEEIDDNNLNEKSELQQTNNGDGDSHDTGTIALDALQEPKSACVSPASSNGGVYEGELLELFGLNLHRIEKDVQRCDRNYWYFANENLDKLRNVICTYVWEHLNIGYMQGMCDLVAPLLVIFDDESLSYGCFCRLMERMIDNFPNGGAMDMHFANMRSLIQILDAEMYDLMHAHGDYTHFYFCYRWFLLDFKREMIYTDIFATWEGIWAAKFVASSQFVLFIALALLETYREIILTNNMDFTDVIKFFNEMAERHDTGAVLKLSRNLVLQLQTIIENN